MDNYEQFLKGDEKDLKEIKLVKEEKDNEIS